MNADRVMTIVGIVSAVLMEVHVDWTAAFTGDPVAILMAVGGVALAVAGKLAKRKKKVVTPAE